MGSLPSPPPAPPPPPPPTASDYRIILPFCSKSPSSQDTTPLSNWLESYNPITNSLSHVAPIPGIPAGHVLKDFSMVTFGASIYIIGGRLFRIYPAASGGGDGPLLQDVQVVPNVLRFDVPIGEWSVCAPLATPRFDFACATCDGKIYVAGGQRALRGSRGISSAEVYDPSDDHWSPLPNMSVLRYKCVGVTWRGRVYIVGGFAEKEGGDATTVTWGTERSSAEAYNAATREWEVVAGMWQLDVPPNQIVAVDGRLLSSGDCLNTWKGHIEAYDGKLNIWNIVEGSQQGELVSPGNRGTASVDLVYMTMAPVGAVLYFMAGYRVEVADGVYRSVSSVHSLDTAAGAAGAAWRSYEPVEEERDKELCGHCCVVAPP